MKKIIIALIVLISIGTAGYYTYEYFNNKPSRQALADKMKNEESTRNTADYSKLLQNNM